MRGPIFVVGSGRSATLSVGFTLLTHDLVSHVTHEGIHDWVALSSAYEYAPERFEDDARKVAQAAYGDDPPIRVESDFKLSPLISVLADEFPESRFVWTVRNGADVVNSMTRMGWYSDEDFNDDAGDYARARLRGSELGVPEWFRLPHFERRAWYWGYINWRIHQQLSALDPERVKVVQVERFDREAAGELFDWIGPSETRPHPVAANRSGIEKRPQWDDNQREAFMRRCATAMDLLYPGWRDHAGILFGDES